MPESADIVADMADMLAASNGKVVTPEVEELLHEALRLDPNQWKALALLAIHLGIRNALRTRRSIGNTLLAAPDFPDCEQIQSNINEAKRLSGAADKMAPSRSQTENASKAVPTVKPGPIASIKGTVDVAASFKDRVKPTDTVFVYARPVEGSKMPVAFEDHSARVALPV